MDASSADTNSATVRTAATVESAALDAALDAMAARPLEDLDVVALGRLVVDTQRDKNRLEAEHARQLATFVARRGWEADGYAGVEAWLRDRCHVSLREAGRLVDTARGLGVLPEAARAFRDGEISRDHARVLTDTVRDLAPRDLDQGGILEAAEVAAEVDDELLDAARKMDPQLLGRAAKKKKDERAPEDPTAAARRRWAARRFRSWRQDGMYAFDGLLPLIDGEKLEVVLNALRTRDPQGTPPEQRRSFQQATADALMAVVDRAEGKSDSPPDTASGPGPRTNVTLLLDWGTLVASVNDPQLRELARRAATGANGSNGSVGPGHHKSRGDRGEPTARLGFAGDVPASMIGRLLCDSSIARVVTGPDGMPLEAGEACPTVPAPLRRAVIARDRHCRAPGCDRPTAWCEVHHVVWQRFGGKTKITTLVLLCTRHHHYVHDLGWKLDLRGDGSCLWTAPAADGGGRWITRPGDPTPHQHDEGDGVAVVAHGSLPSGADARNTGDVRDPAFPATPNGTAPRRHQLTGDPHANERADVSWPAVADQSHQGIRGDEPARQLQARAESSLGVERDESARQPTLLDGPPTLASTARATYEAAPCGVEQHVVVVPAADDLVPGGTQPPVPVITRTILGRSGVSVSRDGPERRPRGSPRSRGDRARRNSSNREPDARPATAHVGERSPPG